MRLFDHPLASLLCGCLLGLLLPGPITQSAPAEKPYPQVWSIQFGSNDSEHAQSLAVDRQDNLYIVGVVENTLTESKREKWDVMLSKLSPKGEVLWTQKATPGQGTIVKAIAVDHKRNVYIAGWTYNAGSARSLGPSEGFVYKYNTEGKLLWTKRIGGEKRGDPVSGLACDREGNLYVTGIAMSDSAGKQIGGGDIYLLKLDPEGETVWSVLTGTKSYDKGVAVAIDKQGNAYVLAETMGGFVGEPIGASDGILMKYTPEGEPVWAKQFGTEGPEQMYSIDLDPKGNVYVAGTTQGSFDEATVKGLGDAVVVKFDAQGKELWAKHYATQHTDIAYCVRVDRRSRVFLSGFTRGELAKNPIDGHHAFLLKLDSDGKQLWAKQYEGKPDFMPETFAIDSNNDVYFVASTDQGVGGAHEGGTDIYVLKLKEP